jgi:outer membrane lipoprotein-sorting protein
VRYDLGMVKALAVVALLAASAAAQPNATTVLGNVQQFYANAPQLSAKFRQLVTNKAFGQTRSSDGDLWVAKPGSVRFDYQAKGKAKIEKSFVYDGTTAWLVDRKNYTIMKQAVQASALPAAMAFLTGGKQLAQQFTIALGTTGTVLELTPKQPSAAYAKVSFVVDPKDWHVTESIVIDSKGDSTEFHFYAQNVNSAQPASFFTVDPKALPGYQLLSARPSGSSSPAPHP